MWWWFWCKRKEQHQPFNLTFAELHPKSAKYLYAVNMQSRMDFTKIAHAHLERYFEENEVHGGDWVTLAPPQYFKSFEEAPEFNVRKLQKWVAQVLRGLNYVAMVELAGYEGRLAFLNLQSVSFHAHAIVWGAATGQLKAIRDQVNARWPAAIPGRSTAHYRPYAKRALLNHVYYMMKAPQNRYRIKRQIVQDQIDATTGEVVADANVLWHVDKDPLYPKAIARMYDAMGRRVLDDLLFSGGEGVAVADAIRKEALKDLPAPGEGAGLIGPNP